jgi:FeS assembly protein IscX
MPGSRHCAAKQENEMKWTDVNDIAIELVESHPDIDPKTVRFVDLHNWVVALPDFDDDHSRGGERVLEAIQQAWIDEAE